jgi:hypothetical protein
MSSKDSKAKYALLMSMQNRVVLHCQTNRTNELQKVSGIYICANEGHDFLGTLGTVSKVLFNLLQLRNVGKVGRARV